MNARIARRYSAHLTAIYAAKNQSIRIVTPASIGDANSILIANTVMNHVKRKKLAKLRVIIHMKRMKLCVPVDGN